MDRTIAQLLGDRRDLRDVRDSSTPLAMLRLLQLIDNGQALSPNSRDRLLEMMGNCVTGRNRIRALLPAGTRVEHKTGTLNGYTGDVAFVTLPDQRRIAMVIFARGGGNRPAVIASAARAIYDGFNAESGSAGTALASLMRDSGPGPGLSNFSGAIAASSRDFRPPVAGSGANARLAPQAFGNR